METLRLSQMKKINWIIKLLFPKSCEMNTDIDQTQLLTKENSSKIEKKLIRMEASLNGDDLLFLKLKGDFEKEKRND